MFSISIFPQRAKKAKSKQRRVAGKTVQTAEPKNADADFDEKLARTFAEPEVWKEHAFVEENFKILFPRSFVKDEEEFYDEAVGKVNVITYLSVGDIGAFAVGTFPMPYAVTDENVLRKFYQQAVQELLSTEEYQVSETKAIVVNGKPALEIIAAKDKNQAEKAKMRILLAGRNAFYHLAIPVVSGKKSEKETLQNRVKFEKQTADFFNSFAELTKAAEVSAANVLPWFQSSYSDGIFRSEYFDFTMKIPKDWIEVAQADIEGMRESGKEFLKENSDVKISLASNARRNLLMFVSKPLGAEKNAVIVCNLTKKPSPSASVLELSSITEQEIKKVKSFIVTKSTHEINLGNIKFVGFEIKGKRADEEFQQMVYFASEKDFALGFTLTYHDEEQKKTLLETLGSIKFKR